VDCGRSYTSAVFQHSVAQTVSLNDVLSDSTKDAKLPATTLRADDDARIGQRLGHYKIECQLGRGGMGTVYRALDESLQRYIALKVIDGWVNSVSDTQQLLRLCQEALAQARVNHPHVAHIYYVGRDDGSPFLAMELVGNETLADRLRSGPLPYAEVIELGGQLCDALRHCLAYDIIHGDIKPSNVLLAEIGIAKLSDFGLARRMSENRDEGGSIAGTPDYLAPEVINGGSTDVQSDLYALGVTLFEMTFGRLPFSYSGSSIVERLEAHKSAPIVFPERWPSEVPHGWRFVLGRLLEKEPDQRYQTYDELIEDLERMRPAKLPKAGRIPRILAWYVDATLLSLVGLRHVFHFRDWYRARVRRERAAWFCPFACRRSVRGGCRQCPPTAGVSHPGILGHDAGQENVPDPDRRRAWIAATPGDVGAANGIPDDADLESRCDHGFHCHSSAPNWLYRFCYLAASLVCECRCGVDSPRWS
jgi:hypothetical protein